MSFLKVVTLVAIFAAANAYDVDECITGCGTNSCNSACPGNCLNSPHNCHVTSCCTSGLLQEVKRSAYDVDECITGCGTNSCNSACPGNCLNSPHNCHVTSCCTSGI